MITGFCTAILSTYERVGFDTDALELETARGDDLPGAMVLLLRSDATELRRLEFAPDPAHDGALRIHDLD